MVGGPLVGIPSTRSAMMLRWISLLLPARQSDWRSRYGSPAIRPGVSSPVGQVTVSVPASVRPISVLRTPDVAVNSFVTAAA